MRQIPLVAAALAAWAAWSTVSRISASRRRGAAATCATTPYGCPLPSRIHVTLRQQDLKPGRLIIVGDVHGCVEELRQLLLKIEFKLEVDNLAFVGDLVNKGPASVEVLRTLRQLGAHAVRGNHDDACLAAWLQHRRTAGPVAAKFAWVAQLSDDDARVLQDLPFTITLPDYGLTLAHAGLVPGLDLPHQKPHDIILMRNLKRRGAATAPAAAPAADGSAAHRQEPAAAGGVAGASSEGEGVQQGQCKVQGGGSAAGPWEALESIQEGSPWAAAWAGPTHVFFGHDARRKLQLTRAATGLDTGCVYGGRLTAAVLPPLSAYDGAYGAGGGLAGRLRRGEAPTLQELRVELVAVQAVAVHSAPTGEGGGGGGAAAAAAAGGGGGGKASEAAGERAAARGSAASLADAAGKAAEA